MSDPKVLTNEELDSVTGAGVKLLESVADGVVFKEGDVSQVKQDPTGLSTGGGQKADDVPTVSLSMSFTKIKPEY